MYSMYSFHLCFLSFSLVRCFPFFARTKLALFIFDFGANRFVMRYIFRVSFLFLGHEFCRKYFYFSSFCFSALLSNLSCHVSDFFFFFSFRLASISSKISSVIQFCRLSAFCFGITFSAPFFILSEISFHVNSFVSVIVAS